METIARVLRKFSMWIPHSHSRSRSVAPRAPHYMGRRPRLACLYVQHSASRSARPCGPSRGQRKGHCSPNIPTSTAEWRHTPRSDQIRRTGWIEAVASRIGQAITHRAAMGYLYTEKSQALLAPARASSILPKSGQSLRDIGDVNCFTATVPYFALMASAFDETKRAGQLARRNKRCPDAQRLTLPERSPILQLILRARL